MGPALGPSAEQLGGDECQRSKEEALQRKEDRAEENWPGQEEIGREERAEVSKEQSITHFRPQRGNQADLVGIKDKRPQPTNPMHDGRLTLAHSDHVRAARDGYSTKGDINCVSAL